MSTELAARRSGTATGNGLALALKPRLDALLQDGLTQRVGRHLYGTDWWVLRYLRARGATARGVYTCKLCMIVFASSAHTVPVYCRDCAGIRHRPVLRKHHVGFDLDALTYVFACEECGELARHRDPRTCHCELHQTGAARTARSRRRR